MSQPSLALACDVCRCVTTDHYTPDGRVVCGGCWDPFGTFDQVSERTSRDGFDKEEDAMLEEAKTGPAGNRTLTTTQSLRSCVMAESILPHPTPLHRQTPRLVEP